MIAKREARRGWSRRLRSYDVAGDAIPPAIARRLEAAARCDAMAEELEAGTGTIPAYIVRATRKVVGPIAPGSAEYPKAAAKRAAELRQAAKDYRAEELILRFRLARREGAAA